jgi:dihydroneopterin aldolase
VPDSLTVTLKAMQFHALVGVLSHERELPQLIEIDITVSCAGENSLSSRSPTAGVDYRDLHDIAREVISAGHVELLEQIAEEITQRVLCVAGVRSSRVAVRKPHAALPGRMEYAEIVLERDADV